MIDLPRGKMIDIETQLRSYATAKNIRMEIREMAQRAADEIIRLRAALKPFAAAAEHFEGINYVPDACPLGAELLARPSDLNVGALRRAREAMR
jgi:hypothetical protein